ncbi:hypothetical protein ACS0TY_010046 [Phlomoides rotata]
METMMENMVITEEEEEDLVVDDMSRIASVWMPKKGIDIKDIENERIMFQSNHIIDLRRVLDGSPWSFGRFSLIVRHLCLGEFPHSVPLNKLAFWVQVFNLPIGCFSEVVGERMGNFIGDRWLNLKECEEHMGGGRPMEGNPKVGSQIVGGSLVQKRGFVAKNTGSNTTGVRDLGIQQKSKVINLNPVYEGYVNGFEEALDDTPLKIKKRKRPHVKEWVVHGLALTLDDNTFAGVGTTSAEDNSIIVVTNVKDFLEAGSVSGACRD